MEEYQPWSAPGSRESSRNRKMSFNPVGTWTEAAGEVQPVGAFEVPKWKRCREYNPLGDARSRLIVVQYKCSLLAFTVCSLLG